MKSLILQGILIVAIIFSLFSSLNMIDLVGSEPLRAAISLEMLIEGEYIVPKRNGILYINKPPMFNWVQASTSILTDSREPWVWRVPGVIALLLTSLGIYHFAKAALGKFPAFLAALFSITVGEIFFFGSVRAAEIDLFLMFLVFGQVAALYYAFVSRHWFWFLLSFIFLAAGVLTKVIPVYLQLTALIALVLSFKKYRWLLNWQYWTGWLFFSLIIGGYAYLYAQSEDPIVLLGNFGSEAMSKTAVGQSWDKILISAFSFPITILFKLLIPWSLFLIPLLKKGRWKQLWENDLIRFCGWFLLISLPVFWVNPELRIRYLYFFVPFFAIILARSASLFFDKENDRWNKTINYIFKAAFFVLPLVFLITPWLTEHNSLAMSIVLSIVLTGLSLVILWAYLHAKFPKILLLIAVMVLVRIDINYIYLPYLENKSEKTEHYAQIDELIKIAGDEPLYYTAFAETRYAFENKLGQTHPYTFIYQIPNQFLYRYSQKTGRVLQFHDVPKVGNLYFAENGYIQNKDVDELYSFTFHWGSEWHMILFRVEESFHTKE